MNVRWALSGGSRRSLGQAADVACQVIADRGLLPQLVHCLVDADPGIRMRAAESLERVSRREPGWLSPYVDYLLTEVADVPQASVRWHLARVLGRVPMPADQVRRAAAVLARNLADSTDWRVLNHSLVTLAGFVREDPGLLPTFVDRLGVLERSRLPSVAHRAARLRRELKGPSEASLIPAGQGT